MFSKIICSIWLTCFLLFAITSTNAQKHDSAYWNSWAKLYKVIDSSYYNRADTSIVEQTALVQFQLTEGKIDTFYIWTTYDKSTSNWMIPFFKSAINRYFGGYKNFKHVIVPIRVIDTRIQDRQLFPPDVDFIGNFIDAFKHAYNGNVTIAQGLLLEPPWPAVR